VVTHQLQVERRTAKAHRPKTDALPLDYATNQILVQIVDIQSPTAEITTTPPQPFYGPFFRDHLGEPVPEENFWALWCKGRLTEADTLTIRLGATPSVLTSAHLHHPPIFLRAGCPSCRPNNSVKALKAEIRRGKKEEERNHSCNVCICYAGRP